MQNGSLVKMVKDLTDSDTGILASNGIKRIPTTGENIYTIDKFFPRPSNFNGGKNIKGCVSLEEFPEITAKRFYFDAELFREIQSPDEVNVQEIVEESIYETIPNTIYERTNKG